MAKDYSLPRLDLTTLVPSRLRNPEQQALLDNLFNRFLTRDESVSIYGYLGKKPTNSELPRIPQPSKERLINELIPVSTFTVGNETHSFTPYDIINKAKALGASEHLDTWLYSQANNYAPPIDLDKFTNFFNYFWVAKAISPQPELAWNPALSPEYYVISRPSVQDKIKLNVKTATTAPITLTGSGYFNQEWTITFISSQGPHGTVDGFNIVASGGGGLIPDTANPISFTEEANQHYDYVVNGDTLLSFDISRDKIFNSAGEYIGDEGFNSGDKFIITAPFLSRTVSVQFIGSSGVKGKIKNVISKHAYQTIGGIQLQAGDRVLVKDNAQGENGVYIVGPQSWNRATDITNQSDELVKVSHGVNANKVFKSSVNSNGQTWATVENQLTTNDWQEGNFWYHRKDLSTLGIDETKSIQATRPIIEFFDTVKLNTAASITGPCDTNTPGASQYNQYKTRFNQLPLFDLFHYNGEHSGTVSGIFFYEEDPGSPIDTVLGRRVVKSATTSGDFVFNHGLESKNGEVLFYKKAGALKSIWEPGATSASLSEPVFVGDGNGLISVNLGNADPYTPQQLWTLTAVNSTDFKVEGSKTGKVPEPYDIMSVDIPYNNGLFSATIQSGSIPFSIGDTFKFKISNLEVPRYVTANEDGTVQDVFGGPTLDFSKVGAWQLPKAFYSNLKAEHSARIPEGMLYSHFRGMLAGKLDDESRNFGGSIKLWTEQFNLLTGLMQQRDVTPLGLIDHAKKQHETSLNSVIDLYKKHIARYVKDYGEIETHEQVVSLTDFLLEKRDEEADSRTVLYDSTSGVKGFAPTLAQLGVVPRVTPGIIFDYDLGTTLIRCHDGSELPLYINTIQFRDDFGITVSRRDMAEVLNAVILEIESRLFDATSPLTKSFFTESDLLTALSGPYSEYLKSELSTWAIQNEYDPLGSDYNVEDPFTWNYSQNPIALTAPLNVPTVPARWFKVLKAHQASVSGVIQTTRPNLEPWKLLGYHTIAEANADVNTVWHQRGWLRTFAAKYSPEGIPISSTTATVNAVSFTTSPINTILHGPITIDSIELVEGNKVLLTSELSPINNGIWVVQNGAWLRAAVPLNDNLVVSVQQGREYGASRWILTQHATADVDPVLFSQVRYWSTFMWETIKELRPSLKLSVNKWSDELLPPYVNGSMPTASEAITTNLPKGTNKNYQFGEGSLVETIWLKSLDFKYALIKSVFKKDPLGWIGHFWGHEWVEVDNILYDARTLRVPSLSKMALHGDAQDAVVRNNFLQLDNIAGFIVGATVTFTRDAYSENRKFAWTIRVNGSPFAYVLTNTLYSEISLSNGMRLQGLKLNDEGIPFRPGDVITVTLGENNNLISSLKQSSVVKMSGFAQTFVQYLRTAGVSSATSYANNALRKWNVNLGYRAGGLVATDDLKIFTEQEQIPESSYQLVVKDTKFATTSWLQALRVSVVSIGSSYKDNTGKKIAIGDASDWIFRLEGYVPSNSVIDYYLLAGDAISFDALQRANCPRSWNRYMKKGLRNTLTLPVTITGLQNLINILYGIIDVYEDDGWRLDDGSEFKKDAETGRTRTWTLEIEKLIDRVYAGILLGEGHVLNPFIDGAWINHKTGILSSFKTEAETEISPGIFDALGQRISIDAVNVTRRLGLSKISSDVPIFAINAQSSEIEHLFIFKNKVTSDKSSGIIYDAFSGSKIATLIINGKTQGNGTLRPEFGGHYLIDGKVKRGIQGAIDDVGSYYNPDKVFEDSTTTAHALSLLGYTKKDYLNNLDISDKTQFNFWRGLIQMKGTNASVDAFTNSGKISDLKVDEYWAYKIAEYGDAREKTYPEIKLSPIDTYQQFTKLQFSGVPLVDAIQVLPGDESRWFSLEDLNNTLTGFEATIIGSVNKFANVGDVILLPFTADFIEHSPNCELINSKTVKVNIAGNISITGYGPAETKFTPLKLINYVDKELAAEISIWHPGAGLHTPEAIKFVNIISNENPAKYTHSTTPGANLNYDPARAWGKNQLGRIWWDTSNLEYVPYWDPIIFPQLNDRLNRWGTLSDSASIDILEWVESNVPPSQYSSAIDGEAFGSKVFKQNRNWAIRPIAWSRSSIPVEDAHLGGVIGSRGAFVSDLNAKLWLLNSGTAVIENGSYSEMGLAVGMHFGAIEDTLTSFKALDEARILGFKKIVSSAASIQTPIAAGTGMSNAYAAKVSLESGDKPTSAVGQLVFSIGNSEQVPLIDVTGTLLGYEVRTFLRVGLIGSAIEDVILIRSDQGSTMSNIGPTGIDNYGAIFAATNNTSVIYDLPNLGLKLKITHQITGTAQTDSLVQVINSVLSGLNLRLYDGVEYEMITPRSTQVITGFLCNDFTDATNAPHANPDGGGIGWRAWTVPTQIQLDADSQYPDSEWYPILGDMRSFIPTVDQIKDGASGGVFNIGKNSIARYKTSWDNWAEIKAHTLNFAVDTSGPCIASLPEDLGLNSISVYVNGNLSFASAFSVVGNTLTINYVPAGAYITVKIRPYIPTQEELEFNPVVKDNLLIQNRFKIDFDYVEIPLRGDDGSITSSQYYFWVKNRSNVAYGKNASIKNITQQIKDGPPQYLTLQMPIKTDHVEYPVMTISGLSYVVTQDNAYKLRLMRDFTLRDDPKDLNLKNTHTEWALIRPGQKTKIPYQLWQKIIDGAAGYDGGGGILPSPVRTSFDSRNGTRSQFGFGAGQIIAPSDRIKSVLKFTILNTGLVVKNGSVNTPNHISFIDLNESENWFETPESTRAILVRIWNEADAAQVNELFFAVLHEIAASNYEMTDLFKTSRLSASAVHIVDTQSTTLFYE